MMTGRAIDDAGELGEEDHVELNRLEPLSVSRNLENNVIPSTLLLFRSVDRAHHLIDRQSWVSSKQKTFASPQNKTGEQR